VLIYNSEVTEVIHNNIKTDSAVQTYN